MMFIKCKGKYNRDSIVNLNHIVSFEQTEVNWVTLVAVNNNTFYYEGTLKEIEEQLKNN